MAASLKDIAKALHVSTTTVSWVLAGHGDQKRISVATQERIRQCAKELNYSPNLLARGLNTGATNTIGLILPDMSDLFYSQVAHSIEMCAEKLGYTLMIASSESDLDREIRMIQMFKAKGADGLIIAPTKYSQHAIEQLMAENYPFVLFDRYFENLKTNYVLTNNEESSYMLVKSLVDQGCRKIAMLLTNKHLKIMQMRYAGYKRALEAGGLTVDPDLCGEVEFSSYSRQLSDVWNQLLERNPDIDGVFFSTHILAMDTFLYFNERKIDLSKMGLACIHDLKSFRLLAPHMKIARLPAESIGEQSVRLLHNNILSKKAGQEHEEVVLPCAML